jgi:hypothetical protein
MLGFHPQRQSVIVDFFGLHDPEEKGTILHRNVGKYSPLGMA